MEHFIQKGRHVRHFFPTGVVRGQGGARLRVNFFDSIKMVSTVAFVRLAWVWCPSDVHAGWVRVVAGKPLHVVPAVCDALLSHPMLFHAHVRAFS